MSELSWLLDLLFNHPVDEKLKKHVVKRIKEVEKQMNQRPASTISQPAKVINGATQSPSFIAAMEKHETPGIVAATAATQAAMASRQAALNMAESGKIMPGQTSPRKF